MASYAGCAGAVLCFLVTAVVYAAVYDSAAFGGAAAADGRVGGAFHFFVAVVVCLHVNLTRSSCMGRWPETVALLVVVCLVQAVVFLDVPEASTRTFFVAYDVAHLVLTGLLVGVSARFLRRRPAVREAGGVGCDRGALSPPPRVCSSPFFVFRIARPPPSLRAPGAARSLPGRVYNRLPTRAHTHTQQPRAIRRGRPRRAPTRRAQSGRGRRR